MNFDFFIKTLEEEREYVSFRNYWNRIIEIKLKPMAIGRAEFLARIPEAEPFDHFRASHITFPAEVDCLTSVEKRFSVILPEDFKEFYNNWSQVLLVLREAFWIMPAEEILRTNELWRSFSSSDNYPCHVIRFARYFDEKGQHFALQRKNAGAPWHVAMVNGRDNNIFDDESEADDWMDRVTDNSFTEWLKRMIETDGTPWFPGQNEESECKTLRMLPGETPEQALIRNGQKC